MGGEVYYYPLRLPSPRNPATPGRIILKSRLSAARPTTIYPDFSVSQKGSRANEWVGGGGREGRGGALPYLHNDSATATDSQPFWTIIRN